MTAIHRIPINCVEVGMYLSDDTPELKKYGFNRRGVISRDETLAKLKSSGIKEVYIDISKGKSSNFSLPVVDASHSIEPKVALNAERERAEKVYSEARDLVGNLVKDVKMGKPIDTAPIENLAEEINESLQANHNALLCLSQIREKDKYLLEHSINVGILMGVFTRYLGYDREPAQQMITGALLHDIGKIRVPDKVLNKAGKLSNEEWEEMKRHVTYGEEVLRNSPGTSDIAIAICAQHHEKVNGKGYPRGLKGEAVTVYGRLASIVDIYDAVTADRVYHNKRSPFDVMRLLSDLARDELDKGLVYQFIRCMSVYPVGTIIELDNGKLGVVVQTNSKKADRPLLKVFYNMRQKYYEAPKFMDLGASNGEAFKIVKVHDAGVLNINVADFM